MWAEERKISESTLAALGVDSDIKRMGNGENTEVIAFPYRRGSRVVATKFRALDSKDFMQTKDPELRFWNLDAVLKSDMREVIITEGEMDALALVEAGCERDQVVSVPNGAPMRSSDSPDEMDRYRYVAAGLKEGLARAKRFIIAVDADGPGLALRQDLVRLLGAARCYFIDWPDGVKDANEFLIRFGGEDLRMYVTEGAKEWPIEGLYRLSELPEQAPLEIWKPGFLEWESKLHFAAKTVGVVTGYPGSGKTVLTMQIWYQICRDYGIKAAVATFETRPKPHQRKNLRQFMHGKPQAELTDEEVSTADRWIDEHIFWMVHPNRKPSLKWLLDTAEVAVVRHNARVIQIDPWNKLEANRPQGMSETDYIGQCIDECLDFANDLNVHMQILAHPAKPADPQARRHAPVLYDIAGSAHWNNKVDQGLSVHRPVLFEDGQRKTEATLHVLKSRFEELGYPCKLNLDFRLSERRYVSVDYQAGR